MQSCAVIAEALTNEEENEAAYVAFTISFAQVARPRPAGTLLNMLISSKNGMPDCNSIFS